MSESPSLRFHVIDAGAFVRVDAAGRIDVAASLRMAREIAAFGGPAMRSPVLVDARGLQGELGTIDIIALVRALLAEREHYQRKLALLVREDAQLARAQFLENFSQNRGLPIAAFADYGKAVGWLEQP